VTPRNRQLQLRRDGIPAGHTSPVALRD